MKLQQYNYCVYTMNGAYDMNQMGSKTESKLTVLLWTGSLRHKLHGC